MDQFNSLAVPHQARKRFGQNFLQDGAIIDRIVRAIGPAVDDRLIEIGPGQGALTLPLVEHLSEHASLDLLEIDRDLAAQLDRRFAHDSRINLHQIDALNFDFVSLREQGHKALRVFGNLPYNISTPLIFHLLEQCSQVDHQRVINDMHFMLQREVVDRMAAQPGTKTYGRLSVMTQYYCTVEPLFEVPPEAFNPQPKVMSMIVRLQPFESLPIIANNPTVLHQVVKAAFSQRRKTLRNGLKHLINIDQLEQLGINHTARAETLPLTAFVKIANFLNESAPTS